MTKFQVGTRFVTTRPLAYNDSGTGLPESWGRQNGCVIVPAGTGGVILGEGHGRGQRSVRFDGCGDHRSFNLHIGSMAMFGTPKAALQSSGFVNPEPWRAPDTGVCVRVGPNDTAVYVTARTPRAVVTAAKDAVTRLTIEDIRVIANWSTYEMESVWDGGYTEDGKPRGALSIVGVLAMWIGCALLDVEFYTGLDDVADQNFMDRLWDMAPRV